MARYDRMGDHDEGTCSKNARGRTEAHNSFQDVWMGFLNACGMRGVKKEVVNWAPKSPGKWANVPDIICKDPMGVKSYVIDCRIAWNHTTGGATNYKKIGDNARKREESKRSTWKKATDAQTGQRDFTQGNTEFVPLSVEITRVWGNATKNFFDTCVDWAGQGRDVDLYTWSSASFKGFWKQAMMACLARERGNVGLKARLRTTDVTNCAKRHTTEADQDNIGR